MEELFSNPIVLIVAATVGLVLILLMIKASLKAMMILVLIWFIVTVFVGKPIVTKYFTYDEYSDATKATITQIFE